MNKSSEANTFILVFKASYPWLYTNNISSGAPPIPVATIVNPAPSNWLLENFPKSPDDQANWIFLSSITKSLVLTIVLSPETKRSPPTNRSFSTYPVFCTIKSPDIFALFKTFRFIYY